MAKANRKRAMHDRTAGLPGDWLRTTIREATWEQADAAEFEFFARAERDVTCREAQVIKRHAGRELDVYLRTDEAKRAYRRFDDAVVSASAAAISLRHAISFRLGAVFMLRLLAGAEDSITVPKNAARARGVQRGRRKPSARRTDRIGRTGEELRAIRREEHP